MTNANGYFNFGITPTVIGGPYILNYTVVSSYGNYSVSQNSLAVTPPILVPKDKVLEGVTIAGKNGTMPDMATRNPNGVGIGRSQSIEYWTGGGSTVFLKPQRGYYDGNNTWVYYSEPNLISGNIKNGISILGVTGSLVAQSPRITAGDDIYLVRNRQSTTTMNVRGTVRARVVANAGNSGSVAIAKLFKNGVEVLECTDHADLGRNPSYKFANITVSPGDIFSLSYEKFGEYDLMYDYISELCY